MTYKPTKITKNCLYTNLKSKIKDHDKSNVIYRIGCQNCDEVYVGQTSKKLKKRLGQHKNDVKNVQKNPNRTALTAHVHETGHIFDYENTKILGVEKNRSKRETIENSHIIIHNSVNKKSDMNITTQFLLPLKTFSKQSRLSPIRKDRHRSN